MRGVKVREPKIGVFLCTCDNAIGQIIDIDELEGRIKQCSNVTTIKIHDKLCGKDGQEFLKDIISSSGIENVVVAACTPRTYGDIVKKGALEAGLNEHQVEQVNIREHCDWIHTNKEKATEKAKIMILAGVAKAAFTQPIEDKHIMLANKEDVLIIGGGVTGITAALELLKNGIKVHLVERNNKLGGRAYDLDPERLDEDGVSLPNIDELKGSENADIILESQIEDISGTFGDYHVKIKTKDGSNEIVVGAIIIATGSELFDASKIQEYRFEDQDVIDFFELEKMLSKKELKVPSTGKVPKRVNFIQCVGSRDENKGNPHCSLVCCTYAIRQAARIKSLSPDIEVYVHYMDLRGPFAGFEEAYLDAQQKGVNFIRGRVAEVLRSNGDLLLRTEHIELGEIMNLNSDMVVLAVGQQASSGTKKLAEMIHLPVDIDGFMGYYNDRFDIIDRRGISIAGCAQGPRGVARSLSDAKKSAWELAQILKNGLMVRAVHSEIDESRCQGCRICEQLCPYEAISMKTVRDYITDVSKLVSSVNLAVCQGCGACAMACPGGVPQLTGFSNKEVLAQIDELI